MLKHKCDDCKKTLWNPSGKRSLGFEIRAMSICWKAIHSVLTMVMMVKMAAMDNGHNDDHGDNGNDNSNLFSMKWIEDDILAPISLIGIVDHLFGKINADNAGRRNRDGRDKQRAGWRCWVLKGVRIFMYMYNCICYLVTSPDIMYNYV